MTLSSTEAEYYSMSQCATEMTFIGNLLNDIGIKNVKKVMNCDNTGAIFLAKNMAVGQRTKHIDTRCHYLRELVEKNELIINYVNTKDNLADLLTKNLGTGSFERLREVIVTGDLEALKEGGC